MKSNIITNSNIQNHKVESYHFRVLLDENHAHNTSSSNMESDIGDNGGFVATDIGAENNEHDFATINNNIQSKNNELSLANEEMFKKIEALSENVVKLQMQIEANEKEFQKRLESEINTAKENAYIEGKNEAKLLYDQEIEKLNEKLLKSVEKIDKKTLELDLFLHKIESELSVSAVDIAEEVVSMELSEHSSKIAYSLSQELIKDIRKDIKVKISINPKDYKYISEQYQSENIQIIPDDAINVGCVMILSDELNTEANVSDRLNKVKSMVLRD